MRDREADRVKRLVLLHIDPLPTASDRSLLTTLGVDTDRIDRPDKCVAEGLLRVLAATECHLPLSSLERMTDPTGKPIFAHHPDCHFNLSHTKGCVLCGVADRPIGVDVEHPREIGDALVRRCFSPMEQALCEGDPSRRVTIWTRKEAVVKWQGVGLSGIRSVDTAQDEWRTRLLSGQIGEYTWSVCIDRVGELQAEEWTWDAFSDRVRALQGG